MRIHRFAPLWAFIALSGCKGCRDDKPYTPFGVTSALPAPPAPTASVEAPAVSASPTEPAVRKAIFTASGARQFRAGERTLESPPGRVFEQVLEADLDGDAATDVAAWTLPGAGAPDPAPPGELWMYPAAGDAQKLFDFPAFVPTGADCRHVAAISLAGPQTLALDVAATCDTPRLARSPTRALALIGTQGAAGLRFGLRVADPAPGEKLTLALSMNDEDADGRADFRLSASLAHGEPDSGVATSLIWLDRAAGVSRDGRQPARDLEAVLSREVVRSQSKKNARSALARAESTRRLLGTLCAEGKVPRVFDWDGAPLRCTNLGTVVDRAAAVDVTAALSLGDPGAALGALGRDGWYFGETSTRQRATLLKDVQKKLTAVPAARIVLGARPRSALPGSYSPLTFEADGTLLMQSDSGLFRLAPDSAREEPVAEGGPAPWPLEVTTAGGERLIAVSYSCDRSEIGLLLAGAQTKTQLTPLLAPRPGVCGGQRFEPGFVPAAISARDEVELLVGGERVGPRGGSGPGSARSLNGRWTAIPTELGLLLQGAGTELWKIDGWNGASGCVVANDARRAACVRRGQAELYLKSALPTP